MRPGVSGHAVAGDILPTGPNFVTARDAGKAIELSKRSIR